MVKIDIKDLVIGNYYRYKTAISTYIIRYEGEEEPTNSIRLRAEEDREYDPRSSFNYIYNDFTEATEEDIAWLEDCIKAKEYLPFDDKYFLTSVTNEEYTLYG